MIIKKIKIDGTEYLFGASGDTPRRYRILTGRDLIKDFQSMSSDDIDSEVLENLAYTMYLQANPAEDKTIDEFLNMFSLLGLYSSYGEFISLWSTNTGGTSKSKKK